MKKLWFKEKTTLCAVQNWKAKEWNYLTWERCTFVLLFTMLYYPSLRYKVQCAIGLKLAIAIPAFPV